MRQFLNAVLACGAVLCVGCAESPDDGETVAAPRFAEPAAPGRCDLAVYPSAEWTQCEQENFAVQSQNLTHHQGLAPGIFAATSAYQQARLAALLADPERQPNPNPCTLALICAIDPRVQNWSAAGGLVTPVLYTSRSGATISGHVWATRAGAPKRPGVVIINGSGVGFEQVYWYAAQALAKAGFVVMTFDAQGEGNSDQFGETPDEREAAFAGTPLLGLLDASDATGIAFGGNGLPFYDGGSDALDFLLSTPNARYVPTPSRTSGTSHAAKQARRVAAGLNAAYNPYWELLDPTRLGVAGHSYGAIAASWLAQADPRVKTAVAWDALCVPVSPPPDEAVAISGAPVNARGPYGLSDECFGAPPGPAPAITKPALSLTADYLSSFPYFSAPTPGDKSGASRTYSQRGVDSGAIVIRGGTHFEFNTAPGGLPATLRGIDLVTWYTVAWFAKYLQDDPRADAMLLSARWRNDSAAGAVDPARDANLYSWHYRSRLDIGLSTGGRFNCENLRLGCAGQHASASDGGPENYSFVSVVTTP